MRTARWRPARRLSGVENSRLYAHGTGPADFHDGVVLVHIEMMPTLARWRDGRRRLRLLAGSHAVGNAMDAGHQTMPLPSRDIQRNRDMIAAEIARAVRGPPGRTSENTDLTPC